jgi:ABC-type sugar transport system ATPase subunit
VAAIELTGVSKRFPTGVVGLSDVSLAVESGECFALLGPSGSGKSTLLRVVAGLEEPDAGDVRIGGLSTAGVPPHKRGLALVPQRVALYPQMTVREHLELCPERAESNSHTAGSNEIIEVLGLGPLLDRKPHELSGGERQRVALARAVARQVGVWLLDEPFAALDPAFRAGFRGDLPLLKARSAATILLVTHDPIDAMALGRRVGVLGDGRLQSVGTPGELARRPGNRFVAFSLGRFCLVDGVVRAGDAEVGEPAGAVFASADGSVVVPVPANVAVKAAPAARNLTLGFRPEDLSSAPPDLPPDSGTRFVGWPAVSAEPDGSGWRLTLVRKQARLQAAWPAGSPPPVGAPRDWFLPADRCHWFAGPAGDRID